MQILQGGPDKAEAIIEAMRLLTEELNNPEDRALLIEQSQLIWDAKRQLDEACHMALPPENVDACSKCGRPFGPT